MGNRIITYANFTAIRNAHKTGEYVLVDTMLKIRNARVKLFQNAVTHMKGGQVIGADDSITVASGKINGVFVDDAIVLCTDDCVVDSLSLFDNSIGIVPSRTKVNCTNGATYLTHKEIKHKQEKFRSLVSVDDSDKESYYGINFHNSPYNNMICVRGYENIEWLMELHVAHSQNITIGAVKFYKEVLHTKVLDIDIEIVNKNHLDFRPVLELSDNALYRV